MPPDSTFDKVPEPKNDCKKFVSNFCGYQPVYVQLFYNCNKYICDIQLKDSKYNSNMTYEGVLGAQGAYL